MTAGKRRYNASIAIKYTKVMIYQLKSFNIFLTDTNYSPLHRVEYFLRYSAGDILVISLNLL